MASDGQAAFNLSALRLNRSRLLVLVGLGILTVALLITLGGGREAVAALADAYWPLVLLATLVHYSGFAVRGHRWQLLLRTMGHRLSYRYVTTLLLSGWFISALLPARAGDAVRIGLLSSSDQQAGHPSSHAKSVPVAEGIGSIVLERALDILAILLLGAGFGFLVLRGQLPNWVMVAYAVGLCLLVAFVLLLIFIPALLDRLRSLWQNALWHRLLHFGEQIVHSLRVLPQHPRVALLILLESGYIWFCDALLLWLVIGSLGIGMDFGAAAFVALTVDVFAAVPLTPGGIGQIEATYGALLALLSQPALNIPAAILLTRAISYWSFLLFSGAVTFAAGIGQVLNGGAVPNRFTQHETRVT